MSTPEVPPNEHLPETLAFRSLPSRKLNVFLPISPEQEREAFESCKDATMFRHMSPENLLKIVEKMESIEVPHGQVILQQGEPTRRAYVLSQGICQRTRFEHGQTHVIDESGKAVFASLHLINEDPTFSTVTCRSDTCRLYSLSSQKFAQLLAEHPEVSKEVIISLSREVRRSITVKRTPLLEQHPKKLNNPLLVYSIAAGLESFYRSALNTTLNLHLAGQRPSSIRALFPNMHQQIPIRIMYINGFKGIRAYLDSYVDPEKYHFPDLARFVMTLTPGLCMTPISSLLEAANVTQNPEPLWRRWTRGLAPRSIREIIFGIGLNQLSDYFEERYPFLTNTQLRNAAGSMTAGVCSGYLTHLVHNLCTLKLMFPHQTYGHHFGTLSQKWIPTLQSWNVAVEYQPLVSRLLAVVAPRGLIIRTSQIVGSFIILNGIIAALHRFQ
jgi:CRP-like cAMP-binding protein